MYQVSVTMVEPRKHDIKVFPLSSSFDTDLFQLEPIRSSPGPTRPGHQRDHLAHGTPRYTQDYVPISPQASSSFNRTPAPSRRASEQDVVLPSVEREAIDLTSSPRHLAQGGPSHVDPLQIFRGYVTEQSQKRKSFPSFQDDREVRVGQDPKRLRPLHQVGNPVPPTGPSQSSHPVHAGNYHPMDAHRRPMAPPAQEFIDLTQSPRRALTNGLHEPPVRPRPEPVSSYVHMLSRRSPPRDVRGFIYDVHAVEPHRGYGFHSDHPEGRAQPVRDYNPVRADQHRPPVDGLGPRYLRNDLH
jgi:hypothetical protein